MRAGRRTSIGVELITKPSILFLDEPTSGLDSFAAYVVVNILKDLARSGCTVLCTIHQPSSEVFHLFDRVLLLSEGRTLYDGAVAQLSPHLASLGLAVPDETNPADHIMFLMQTLDKAKLAAICDEYEAGHRSKMDPHAVPPEVAAAAAQLDGGLARRQAGVLTQFMALGVRDAQNVIRDRGALGARFGVAVMLNLLFGLLFLHIGDTSRPDYNITSHFGALVMIGVSGMMGAAQVRPPSGPLSILARLFSSPFSSQPFSSPSFKLASSRYAGAARSDAAYTPRLAGTAALTRSAAAARQPVLLLFPSERPRFVREYATGTYGAAAYFCSKLVTELPLSLSTSLLAFIIGYWMVGLHGSFILHVLITWLIGLCAASTALLFGCVAANAQEAMQAAPAIFVPQILFAGLFVQIDQIPVWIRWAQYLCSLKFGMNLFLVNEFAGAACDPAQRKACDALLASTDADQGIWYAYVLILVGIFLLFRVLGLLVLTRKARGFALA